MIWKLPALGLALLLDLAAHGLNWLSLACARGAKALYSAVDAQESGPRPNRLTGLSPTFWIGRAAP